jgi:hypothetical protein
MGGKRITTDIAVVIDSERSAEAEALSAPRAAFAKTCEELGFDIHVLDRRATENYFSDRAVKAVKGDKYGALGHFESLKDADPACGKHENWRIAGEMTLDELAGTDLKDFLDRAARTQSDG